MPADAAPARLLSRAYSLILAWPCPTCGQPGPCQCDEQENETAAVDTFAGTATTAADKQHHEGATHAQA